MKSPESIDIQRSRRFARVDKRGYTEESSTKIYGNDQLRETLENIDQSRLIENGINLVSYTLKRKKEILRNRSPNAVMFRLQRNIGPFQVYVGNHVVRRNKIRGSEIHILDLNLINQVFLRDIPGGLIHDTLSIKKGKAAVFYSLITDNDLWERAILEDAIDKRFK